jgi:hypothetical protein
MKKKTKPKQEVNLKNLAKTLAKNKYRIKLDPYMYQSRKVKPTQKVKKDLEEFWYKGKGINPEVILAYGLGQEASLKDLKQSLIKKIKAYDNIYWQNAKKDIIKIINNA